MPTNFYYWRNSKFGPKHGALIFAKGYMPFNLEDQESFDKARERLGDAIGEVWKAPADGKHTAEGRYGHTSGHRTIAAAVNAYRKLMTESIEHQAFLEANPAAALDEELSRHDWWYHMSDDHSVWSGGEAHWRKIRALMDKVPVETAQELFKKYAPKEFTCPV